MLYNYYRRITEALPQRVYFANLFLLFLAVSFVLSSVLAALAYVALEETKNVRRETLSNFNYWKDVSERHPNSPDAFYEAGYYAARIGDRDTASKFLDGALRLDPSFEKAKLLEKLIANGQ